MEKRKEAVFGKDGGGGGVGDSCKSKDAFIDRSKVRILLCDNDENSSGAVFTLLCECSYQVTSVRSARQVIDALNAVGPDIDIILAEVDLPMAKGMKMLKYITRDKELRRIPVIMMSAQDEVSVVVKCLRLGAADYLVKPLRTNELLNLWTHMWRRRRMLGLAEKNLINYDFDLVISEPSDANTNSTTLFSDDTDDKSWKSTNPETCISTHQEDESNAAAAINAAIAAAVNAAEPPLTFFSEYRPDVPGISDRRTGQFSSCPKKSELKVGESSAFFTYVKSSIIKNTPLGVSHNDEIAPQHSKFEEKHQGWDEQVCNETQEPENAEAWENYSQCDDFPSSSSVPESRSSSNPREFPQQLNSKEDEFCPPHQPDVSNFPPHTFNPYYMSGVMNQVMMPSSAQLHQKNLHTPMMPQYNHLPQMLGMTSFPYYPLNFCLQPGQIPTTNLWPSFQNSNNNETKSNKVDRREAALIKFRQKRKERCFDKKIRYVNRKRLAERRPRVRGQFVRKVNGINVDLNGRPASADYDEDEEEDYDDDDHAPKDYSPEDAASGYQCR